MVSAASSSGDAERDQRRLAEAHRRFEGLADLVVDAGADEAERMAAVEGADEELGERELGLDDLDDAVGLLRLVDADEDRLGAAGAGGAQHVEPGAVAIVDLEAEAGGGPDHVGVGIDDRDVDLAGEQRLARHLAEAAEADDQRLAGEAVRLVDAVEALPLRQQPARARSARAG